MRPRSWQPILEVGVPPTDRANWALTRPGLFLPAFEFRFALFRLSLFFQFTFVSQKVHERTGIDSKSTLTLMRWGLLQREPFQATFVARR